MLVYVCVCVWASWTINQGEYRGAVCLCVCVCVCVRVRVGIMDWATNIKVPGGQGVRMHVRMCV